MNKIQRFIARTLTRAYGFKTVGHKSYVFKPMQINNANGITLGEKVGIHQYAWLMGSADGVGGLVIGDRTTIGHFAHIIAIHNVEIGNDVLIADRVFISDCTHSYENIDIPIQNQPVKRLRPVSIGDGTWLGENVCICGANVGLHSVIGANSLVLTDIPDYSVAVGTPAKVIKRYDFSKGKWVKA